MSANVSSPVFTLVSASKQISFNVPPSDAPFLRPGMPIVFSFQGKDHSVRISQAPAAPISGVLPMMASAAGLGLQYGTVGEINYRIPLARGAIVPIDSLGTLENRNFVYVIQNDKVEMRTVTIAAESGTTAAVDGLSDGEVIVVSPPPGLLAGSQVQPTMIAADGSVGAKVPAVQESGAAQGGVGKVGQRGGAQYSGQRNGGGGSYSGTGSYSGSGSYSGQRQGSGSAYQGQGATPISASGSAKP
jgi:hypothetical protein